MTKHPKRTPNRRAIAPEDLLRFRVVSDPQIAPDGRRIVFVEMHAGPRNEYVSNLWMVGAEKGTGQSLPHPRGRLSPHPLPLSRKERGESVPQQFTNGGNDHTPRWSPDGARIAFIRSAAHGGQAQIYTIAAAGGEARKLTDFPEGAIRTFRWSPDGKWLAVSFRPEAPQWTEAAKEDRKAQGLSDPPRVIEGLWYRHDGDGYFGARRHALYLVDVRGKGDRSNLPERPERCCAQIGPVPFSAMRLLYGEDTLGEFSFDFSPDSRQLVVATNRDREPTLHPEKDELLRIAVATGKITPIPGLPPGPKTSVRWSPDGRTIAYAGRIGTDPLYSTENAELFVCDVGPRKSGLRKRGQAPFAGTAQRVLRTKGACPLFRSLTVEADVCLRAEGIADTAVAFGDPALRFSPDSRRIYMRLSVRGESHVASVAVRGGPLVFHTRGARDVRMGNFSRDGRRMALTVGDAITPAEVAVLDCGAGAANAVRHPRKLTNLNGPLLAELRLSRPESHWIRSADGHRFQVWIIRPPCGADLPAARNGTKIPAAKRQRKLPAVLEIHGGPHAQYCATLFHEFQVLAAAGHVVFYSNPRGSKGYGRDHCAAIRGRWGTADWTDVQAVIALMKRQPFVDPRRLGVIGGSYGGYMTNWVISHRRDFAAAVSDRSISNLVSWSGTTDIIEPTEHYFAGNFWDQPEARWEQSPLKHLGRVKTPTLIIHSEGDLRCSIEQAEQLYAALNLLGVPARFVRYPANTSHGMSRNGPPDLRLDRLRQILAWWRKYLGPPAGRSRNGKS
jgi:acylaminoacyl-peptidase